MVQAPFPPRGTTDCHTHVAGRPNQYSMVSPRAYTPMEASPAHMRTMMDKVGIDRIVLVQMSVYGTDNSCMLDAMKILGPCSRGVVQLPPDFPREKLDALHGQGVRGIRVNLNTMGRNEPEIAREGLQAAARLCARNGWHLQLFTTPEVIAALGAELAQLPVPVVFDHFGLLSPVLRGGEAERIIMNLLTQGRGWVKVSGTYRLSPADATEEIAALARDLYRANPDHVVWGSDWPHSPHHSGRAVADPPPAPYRDLDPAALLDTVRQWFAEPRERHSVLVDNPARLYDF